MFHARKKLNRLPKLLLLLTLLVTGWRAGHAQMVTDKEIVLEYMPFQDSHWGWMKTAIKAGMAKNGLKKFAQYSIETASDGSDSAALQYYWKFDSAYNLVQEINHYRFGDGIDIWKYLNGETWFQAQFIHYTECKVSAAGNLVYAADTVVTYPIDPNDPTKRLTDSAGRKVRMGIRSLNGDLVAIELWSGFCNIERETDEGICVYFWKRYPSEPAEYHQFYSKSGTFERMEISCIAKKGCTYPAWWDSTITRTTGSHWLMTTVDSGIDKSDKHFQGDHLVKLNAWNQLVKKWELSSNHIKGRLVEKQYLSSSKNTFHAMLVSPDHLTRVESIYQLNEMGLPIALTITRKDFGLAASSQHFVFNYFE